MESSRIQQNYGRVQQSQVESSRVHRTMEDCSGVQQNPVELQQCAGESRRVKQNYGRVQQSVVEASRVQQSPVTTWQSAIESSRIQQNYSRVQQSAVESSRYQQNYGKVQQNQGQSSTSMAECSRVNGVQQNYGRVQQREVKSRKPTVECSRGKQSPADLWQSVPILPSDELCPCNLVRALGGISKLFFPK